MSSLTQLSPAVNAREVDLTNTIPNVGASGGAFVGNFSWGPVETYVDLQNEIELLERFYKPNDQNFTSWFGVADFLAYTGNIKVVRVVDEDAINASDDSNGLLVKNDEHFELVRSSDPDVRFLARFPGAVGNGLRVSVADHRGFADWEYADEFDFAPGTSEHAMSVGAETALDELHAVVVDGLGVFTGVPGAVLERFPFLSKALDAKDANNAPNYYINKINRDSKYVRSIMPIDGAAVSDVVSTVEGAVTGVTIGAAGVDYDSAPTVTFSAPPAGGVQATGVAVMGVGGAAGTVASVTITEPGSGYLSAPTVTFSGGTPSTPATATAAIGQLEIENAGNDWGTPLLVAGVFSEYATLVQPVTYNLSGGMDSTAITADELITGLQMFTNAEEVDVSLLFVGDAGGSATDHKTVVQYAIDNIAETRKDVLVFFSPILEDVMNKDIGDAAAAVVARRNSINRSSSYAVMDSGWKLRYDVHNDKYRYLPLNADIAGLCAQVDNTNDPWWSPGGYNRGRLKNVVSLTFNPNKLARDNLYKVGVNPVVTFNVDGTILYGDKTLQGKQSAFSYIGIRRLFILLRKAISNAAKYFLFEFNDQFTRAQFVSMVTPYLREIQGRRGFDSFHVECSSVNNTPEVIMRGEFIGSIFIKPNYSIQYVSLNFVAVRRDVAFEEVAGQAL